MATLKEARAQIVTLKEEVDRLAQPPSGYGVFLTGYEDGTVDVFTGGRKLRVAVSPAVEVDDAAPRPGGPAQRRAQHRRRARLRAGRRGGHAQGDPRGRRPGAGHLARRRGAGRPPGRHPARLAAAGRRLAAASSPARRTRTSGSRRARSRSSSWRRCPDIDYADIGGLDRQIEQIRDAVELPFLHADLFREHQLRPPKGVLLYGPPGCGKTLIAKAVANSLAKKIAERTGEREARPATSSTSRVRSCSTSTSARPSGTSG